MSKPVMSCEAARSAFARLESAGKEDEPWGHLETCDDCMDAWLVFSLEQEPQVSIPESFPHTVASAYRPRISTQTHRYTLWTSFLALSAVVLLVLSIVSGRQWPDVSFQILLTILTLEASALVLWLGRTSLV
jgi:hypothetical protein